MRILIAEDEKTLNRILVKQFTKIGYSVDSCFDGESVPPSFFLRQNPILKTESSASTAAQTIIL